MSYFLWVLARERPFPSGEDAAQRVMFSCNYEAVGVLVDQWPLVVARRIIEAGGGSAVGSDVFVGPKAQLPVAVDPVVSVISTSGAAPMETHNGGRYERLSVQVVVRSKEYSVGEARALLIWRALDGLRNIELTA